MGPGRARGIDKKNNNKDYRKNGGGVGGQYIKT